MELPLENQLFVLCHSPKLHAIVICQDLPWRAEARLGNPFQRFPPTGAVFMSISEVFWKDLSLS